MQYSIWDKEFSAWLVAGTSQSIKKGKVYHRKIMKRDMVLFRDAEGKVAALKDQCPHKGLPLSMGRMNQGNVTCGYHGWSFDGSGTCVDAPCLNEKESCPNATVESYPLVEKDGWIWIFWGNDAAIKNEGPPDITSDPDLKWFDLERTIKAQPHFILENTFDATHVCFVHSSILRNGVGQLADSNIEETDYGLFVETWEKDAKKINTTGIKLLPAKSRELYHTEQFYKPFISCVTYYFGKATHRVYMVSCPEDENTTRVYTRSGASAGIWTYPWVALLKILTPIIVNQDVRTIEAQAAAYAKNGGAYGPMKEADIPAVWMFRIYRQFFEGKQPVELKTKKVSYWL